MLGSALSSDFVTEGRSLILAGKPGRSKTHLAIAIAYRAIQNDFDAFFTTAATLIDDLSAAFRAGAIATPSRASWSLYHCGPGGRPGHRQCDHAAFRLHAHRRGRPGRARPRLGCTPSGPYCSSRRRSR